MSLVCAFLVMFDDYRALITFVVAIVQSTTSRCPVSTPREP
jgi:hypothetical protein